MKTKKQTNVKARKCEWQRFPSLERGADWHLPATAEAFDAMVEQAARLMQSKRETDFSEAWDGLTTREQENRRAYARLCLKAIGIVRPREDGK